MQTLHARALVVLSAALAALPLPVLAQDKSSEPEIATYSIETRLRLVSDRRLSGTSETLKRPGAELRVVGAHESGLVGVAEIATVSKHQFPEGNGTAITLGGGYRWGDPERWHFGLGLAHENFPGSEVRDVPLLDGTLTPIGTRTVNFNTSYALFEFGFGALEGRYAHVISKNFRGAETATICGTLIQEIPDLAVAAECYSRGDVGSRGTQILDLDYRYKLNGSLTLLAHGGIRKMKNFSEADIKDYRLGVEHRRWGIDWIAEVVGADAKVREVFISEDNGERVRTDTRAVVLTASYTF